MRLSAWGGATFDVCLRYLHEDPWERLRKIREKMPNTKLQMLLRGQNVLGYSHYPDDFVKLFVSKAVENGIDVIRVFDALNDVNNLKVAMEATTKAGAIASGTISYTTSPVHTQKVCGDGQGAEGNGRFYHLHQGYGGHHGPQGSL